MELSRGGVEQDAGLRMNVIFRSSRTGVAEVWGALLRLVA